MLRTTLTVLAGLLLGLMATAVLLWLTFVVIRWRTDPQVFEVEYRIVYLCVVLGSGFGAVCGGLVGISDAIARLAQRQALPGPADRSG